MRAEIVSLCATLWLSAACAADDGAEDGTVEEGEGGGGKADDPAAAAGSAISDPECFLPGGDGWIQASVFVDQQPDAVVVTAYVGGMFDGAEAIDQLRAAGEEYGVPAASLDDLNAFRVRFTPGQCYVAPDKAGLLACSVYDAASQPTFKFDVDFLNMDSAGVWGPAEATVLASAPAWVSAYSTIQESTFPDQRDQSYQRYYVGNDFILTFARAHTNGGIINFSNIILPAVSCE